MRRVFTAAAALIVAFPSLAQSAEPWAEWTDDTGPIAREHATVLEDPSRDRVVFYAGSGYRPQMSPLTDAWAIDAKTGEWSQLETKGDLPAGGGSKRAAPDGDGGFFLFAGYTAGFAILEDLVRVTLEDDALVFADIEQHNAPPARALHAFIHDAPRDRWILYAGVSQQAMYDDVWEMTLKDGDAHWRQLDVARGPGERYGFAYAADAAGDQLIVVSGAIPAQGLVCAKDAWALDLAADPPVWNQIAGEDDAPAGRRNPLWAFDHEHRRLVITGGTADGRSAEQDLLELDLRADSPTFKNLDTLDVVIRASGMGAYDVKRNRFIFGMGNNAQGAYLDLYTVK